MAAQQSCHVGSEAILAKLALLGVFDAVRAESIEDELGIGERGSLRRHQMSELARTQSTIKLGGLLTLDAVGASPACDSGPPGLAAPEPGLFRQMPEPVKVHVPNLSGDFPKRWVPTGLGKLAAESSDDGETFATSHSTMSGDDLDSELPSSWAGPPRGSQRDPLLPCWVRQGSLSRSAVGVGSPGQTGTSSLAVMVRSLPRAYTEDLFLEELRDGGFIKKRDFDRFELNLHEGSCFVRFVNMGVKRSFVAAFDGKEMRHAGDREFVVVPL